MGHIHEHTHEGHTHDHTHDGHTHVHSHDDHAAAAESAADPAHTKALLEYMISHNEHHAEELADLAGALPERAEKKLMRAIGTFEAANVELREVLACLE